MRLESCPIQSIGRNTDLTGPSPIGGPGPVRRFLPDLIDRIWTRQIDRKRTSVPATGAEMPSDHVRRRARITSGLVATVIFLTAIASLATDMYVPAFPAVVEDLSASAAQMRRDLTRRFLQRAATQQETAGPVTTSAA
jgi:hypothetical protein